MRVVQFTVIEGSVSEAMSYSRLFQFTVTEGYDSEAMR